ncbi:MAG TPA: hypothetical protein VFU06_11805 [Longimicrobiales bacterium]|nr:hypothetical protein [Longimicrobiales bacterium]
MSVTLDERIIKDGRQVGIITISPTGQYGYSLFGTPHQGPAKDADEAQQAVLRALA